jgi:hypothetical protein
VAVDGEREQAKVALFGSHDLRSVVDLLYRRRTGELDGHIPIIARWKLWPASTMVPPTGGGSRPPGLRPELR